MSSRDGSDEPETGPDGNHHELMAAAIERDGAGQRALMAGDEAAARAAFAEAAALYRRSWELASATSYGRLIGLLKSAILAGGGEPEAGYVRAQLPEDRADSPAAAYALALTALIREDDGAALRWSERMRAGSEPFVRAADAIAALGERDGAAYAAAVRRIVDDFEQRSEHLTGVAIADTALMLQRLAARRGLAAELASPVVPGT